MFGDKLSGKEKLALYALANYPLHNDRELSELVSLKMSTLTVIRNRLLDRGLINPVRIPRPDLIDSKMTFCLTLRLDPGMPEDGGEVLSRAIRELLPQAFHSVHDDDTLLALGYCDSHTELMDAVYSLKRSLTREGILDPGTMRTFPFPAASSRIHWKFSTPSFLFNNMDLRKALRGSVNTDDEGIEEILKALSPRCDFTRQEGDGAGMKSRKARKLRKKERMVLGGIVELHSLPDDKIAGRLGVSRQLVSRSRKDFEEMGLIETLRIPDLKGLGASILTTFHLGFAPDLDEDELEKRIGRLCAELGAVFLILYQDCCICAFPAGDFQSYKALKKTFLSSVADLMGTEPSEWLISLPGSRTPREFDFCHAISQDL